MSSGYATQDGTAGADYWLKMYGQLPSNYINKTALLAAGWYRGQAPSDYVPGKMATMGIYQNRDGYLPSAPGRIWYATTTGGFAYWGRKTDGPVNIRIYRKCEKS